MKPADRRRVLTSVIGSVAIIAAGVLAWMWWPTRVPAVDAPAGEVVAFMASDRFNSLPNDRQRAYMEALRPQFMTIAMDQSIPEETKMQALENAMNARSGMNQRVDDYFKLPPGPAREKYLDQIIAQTPAAATRPA